jgi:hypothetical protein
VGVTEDLEIGILRRENESINFVWGIKVDAPVKVPLAEVVKEAGGCRAGAQCWRVIA